MGKSETRLNPSDFWLPAANTVIWVIVTFTGGWPLKEWSWVPDVVADTAPVWIGVMVISLWLILVHKLIKKGIEIANRLTSTGEK